MSHRILALDTTGEFGSLALLQNGQVLEEILLHSPEGFGHVLFSEIEALLLRHGVEMDDIDTFAAASGPGSFTGVRVGLTAVKGLAEATGRKVVAVSNLRALAWFGTGPLRAVVLDARRGEIFGAVYDAGLREVCAEVVMAPPAWITTLPEGDIQFITAGFPLAGWVQAPIIEAPRALAAAIGKLALLRIEHGLGEDPAAIDANYVRRSDAELMWKDSSILPAAP